MPIKIEYTGPYKLPYKSFDSGGIDLKAIKSQLENEIPNITKYGSGVYIYLKQTHGICARYVGVATSKNLLKESLNKVDIICNHLLPEYGSTHVLFLVCKKPKGMSDLNFKKKLIDLEEFLILDLSLKGHSLINKKSIPKRSIFNFNINNKSNAAIVFKGLVFKKGIPHI